MRVTWTPLNEPVVDHYTVHYTLVGSGGRRRRQVSSGVGTFPASVSSGVVSGLQEGQQYQFSVSVSLLIDGQTYTSTPGEPVNAMTGKHDLCTAECLLILLEMIYLSNFNFKIIMSINSNVCTTTYHDPLLTSFTVFTTVLPSSFPPSLTSSCLSYSAGLGVVSVIMITSLIGNLVLLVTVCVLLRRKHSFGQKT